MITNYEHLETERRDSVLIVRLANETARNALTREMRFALREVTREIQDDYSIRAVYLTAKGQTFCAGGDLRMLADPKTPFETHRRFRHASTFMPQFLSLDRPVVCGVRGAAVGGGLGLALMADAIVAGTSAKFMAGFFRLGVTPDCLTLFTLPRLVGLAKAREFIYFNGTWDAQQALANGIAARVVDDEKVDEEGIAIARKFAEGPAEVMGLAKTIMLKSFESSLAEMMDYEDLAQTLSQSGPEFAEGIAALLEGRAPNHGAAARQAGFADGMSSGNGAD